MNKDRIDGVLQLEEAYQELVCAVKKELAKAEEVVEYQRKRGLRTTKYEAIREVLMRIDKVIAKNE